MNDRRLARESLEQAMHPGNVCICGHIRQIHAGPSGDTATGPCLAKNTAGHDLGATINAPCPCGQFREWKKS